MYPVIFNVCLSKASQKTLLLKCYIFVEKIRIFCSKIFMEPCAKCLCMYKLPKSCSLIKATTLNLFWNFCFNLQFVIWPSYKESLSKIFYFVKFFICVHKQKYTIIRNNMRCFTCAGLSFYLLRR